MRLPPDAPETLAALESKHHPPETTCYPSDAPDPIAAPATPQVLHATIASFRNGSASGLHGRADTATFEGLIIGCHGLLSFSFSGTWRSLSTLCSRGKFARTSLTHFCVRYKNYDSVRPIIIGHTIPRVVSKIYCRHICLPTLRRTWIPAQTANSW